MCAVCDTLRTDDDTGDECVGCGAVYQDRHPRVKPTPAPLVMKERTISGVAGIEFNAPRLAHRRPGWYRNIQLHPTTNRRHK